MDNQYGYNYQQNGYYYQPPQNGYQYPPQGYAQPYPPAPAPTPKKTYEELTKKDSRIIRAMLIIAFLFFDLALFKGFYIGFTVFYLIYFIATTLYLPNRKMSLFAFLTGTLSVAGSFTFAISSNVLIKVFMFVLIALLYALYCLEISDSWSFRKSDFKALFDVFLSYLIYPILSLPALFGSARVTSKRNKRLVAILIGIAISLPVLLVVVPLLVKGDAAFEGLVTTIFKNIGLVIFEIVLAVIFAPYLISKIYGEKHQLNKKDKPLKDYKGFAPVTVSVTFLSVISVTYIVYLISQLAYFFSAFSGILPEDYEKTASAFARRGFYEMFAVCVINVLIISIVAFVTKRVKDGAISGALKGLSCFISLFSVFLIVTALAKMKLNVETYGFTANRLLVTAFIIMVFFAIILFVIRIFVPKFNYFQPLVIICATIFVALAFLNVDAFVANYNVRAYQEGKLDSVDVDNIDTVAGIPYLIELIDDGNERIASHAANVIVNRLSWGGGEYIDAENDDEFAYSGKFSLSKEYDFRRYCYTDYEAYKTLIDYGNSLDKNERTALQGKADNYWKYSSNDDIYYDDDTGYYDFDAEEVLSYVGTAIDFSFENEEVIYQKDTHDGVNGDGIYYAEISFDTDKPGNEIMAHPDWNEMPLPVNIDRAIYGEYDEENGWDVYSSILETEGVGLSIPTINNGYYYLVDRSPDGAANDLDMDYIPQNFTLAIYDSDMKKLYFIEYDS